MQDVLHDGGCWCRFHPGVGLWGHGVDVGGVFGGGGSVGVVVSGWWSCMIGEGFRGWFGFGRQASVCCVVGWSVGFGDVVGGLGGCISGGWAVRYEGLLTEWSRRWWWCGAYSGAACNGVVW